MYCVGEWGYEEVFGPNREEAMEAGEACIMRSFVNCMVHEICKGVIKSRRIRWAGRVARMG
jgi:hypothetical protein